MTPQGITDIMANAPMLGNAAQNAQKRPYRDVVRYELDYVTAGLHKSVDEAHKAVQWLINDIEHRQADRRRWVSLLGASGCGKTHLARKTVEVLLAAGRRKDRVQFWTWQGAMQKILEDRGAMAWLCNLHVLVLDDIGTGYDASDKARTLNASLLYELLEGRMGKWTLITSNLSVNNIAERLDVRIASRLFRGNNVIVRMDKADDYCIKAYNEREAQNAH